MKQIRLLLKLLHLFRKTFKINTVLKQFEKKNRRLETTTTTATTTTTKERKKERKKEKTERLRRTANVIEGR